MRRIGGIVLAGLVCTWAGAVTTERIVHGRFTLAGAEKTEGVALTHEGRLEIGRASCRERV